MAAPSAMIAEFLIYWHTALGYPESYRVGGPYFRDHSCFETVTRNGYWWIAEEGCDKLLAAISYLPVAIKCSIMD